MSRAARRDRLFGPAASDFVVQRRPALGIKRVIPLVKNFEPFAEFGQLIRTTAKHSITSSFASESVAAIPAGASASAKNTAPAPRNGSR